MMSDDEARRSEKPRRCGMMWYDARECETTQENARRDQTARSEARRCGTMRGNAMRYGSEGHANAEAGILFHWERLRRENARRHAPSRFLRTEVFVVGADGVGAGGGGAGWK